MSGLVESKNAQKMTLSAQQNLVWVTGCKIVLKCYIFCTSKCPDDVNFQSILIVLKGNWKTQRFWYCEQIVTHVSENLEKVNDFYYLVSYVAFTNINVRSVRLQINKSPVILLFYFLVLLIYLNFFLVSDAVLVRF